MTPAPKPLCSAARSAARGTVQRTVRGTLPSTVRSSVRGTGRARAVARAALAIVAVALAGGLAGATGAPAWGDTTRHPTSTTPAAISIAGTRPAAVSGSTDWRTPVDTPLVLVRDFVSPETPYGPGHRGVDLHASAGVTVFAPAAGVVHFTGWVVDRPVLSIDHGAGLVSSFEPVDSLVAIGERVEAGQPVATVAAGPHCDLGCLHMGLRLHGEYLSPLVMFGMAPRAVLLPVFRAGAN